jgi:hypothetical protein
VLELQPAQHTLHHFEDVLGVQALLHQFGQVYAGQQIVVVKEVQQGLQLLQNAGVRRVAQKFLYQTLGEQPIEKLCAETRFESSHRDQLTEHFEAEYFSFHLSLFLEQPEHEPENIVLDLLLVGGGHVDHKPTVFFQLFLVNSGKVLDPDPHLQLP